MSPRNPENLVNVRAIAFLLDMKAHVEHTWYDEWKMLLLICYMDTCNSHIFNNVVAQLDDKYVIDEIYWMNINELCGQDWNQVFIFNQALHCQIKLKCVLHESRLHNNDTEQTWDRMEYIM